MVIIFCGLPGSGKSTLAKKLAKQFQKSKKSYKLFISDKVGSRVYQKVQKFLKQNLKKVDFLILDATFYKKKWRDNVVKIAKDEKILTIFLDCSLETCLLRNKKRKPAIPEKAIYIIYHEMERPKKPDLVINTEKVSPDLTISKILQKVKNNN